MTLTSAKLAAIVGMVTMVLAFGGSPVWAQSSVQWSWKDASGHTVFSDVAPPADIPASRILKSPASATAARENSAPIYRIDPAPSPVNGPLPPTRGTAAPAGDPASQPSQQPSAQELARQKKEELARLQQQKQEAEQARARAADNCSRARSALALYSSGQRVATLNDKGERVVLDDATRQRETQRLQGIADRDCKLASEPAAVLVSPPAAAQ